MKEISSAKNKSWKEMTDKERRAFVEAVCMKAQDYSIRTESSNRSFFKYWSINILVSPLSTSEYMNVYWYHVRDHQCILCILSSDGQLIDISNNMTEVKQFVHNAVSEVPNRSSIVDAVLSGKKKFELIRDGVVGTSYTGKIKKGRKPTKDSLRQKILRGEITRYEAYEKGKRKPRILNTEVMPKEAVSE